jgi:hypothetical protein
MPFVLFSNGKDEMATLSELVNTIAAVEGIDPATAALIARYIREAGLISTGGRGPSAAMMNVRDAANLLIGVNTATAAIEAENMVRAYRELEAKDFTPGPPAAARKYGTFGEAIEQLLIAIRSGYLPDQFMGQGASPELQQSFPSREVKIDLKFRRSGDLSAFLGIGRLLEPDLRTALSPQEILAKIRWDISLWFYPPELRRPRKKQGVRLADPTEWFRRDFDPVARREREGRGWRSGTPDRIDETTIGLRTVSAVAGLLYREALPSGALR